MTVLLHDLFYEIYIQICHITRDALFCRKRLYFISVTAIMGPLGKLKLPIKDIYLF